MKKYYFSLLSLLLVSLSTWAGNFNLPLGVNNDLNAEWGNSTYDAATKTITYVSDWTGRGWAWWGSGIDYSQYDQVVIEFEPIDTNLKLVVQYYDANGDIDDEKNSEDLVFAGGSKLTVTLHESYKSKVAQIYIQRETAGIVVLKEAYLSGEELKGKEVAIPFDEEHGHILLSNFVDYPDETKVKVELNVKTDGSTEVGWGIAAIRPIGNYEITQYTLNCQAISDEGEINTYWFTIGDFKEFAKVEGEYYTNEYDMQGITINAWNNATLVSVTALIAEEEGEKVELPLDGENIKLADYENYPNDAKVKITLSVSNKDSEVGPGWGIGSIHPISEYSISKYDFLCKAASEEGTDNVYSFTIADLKEFAKIDGEYFTDEWEQQGISINLYNGATLKSVMVVGLSTGIEAKPAANKQLIEIAKNCYALSERGTYKVVSISGAVVKTGIAEAGEEINLNALPKGIYVLIANGAAYKTAKR